MRGNQIRWLGCGHRFGRRDQAARAGDGVATARPVTDSEASTTTASASRRTRNRRSGGTSGDASSAIRTRRDAAPRRPRGTSARWRVVRVTRKRVRHRGRGADARGPYAMRATPAQMEDPPEDDDTRGRGRADSDRGADWDAPGIGEATGLAYGTSSQMEAPPEAAVAPGFGSAWAQGRDRRHAGRRRAGAARIRRVTNSAEFSRARAVAP